MSTISENIPKYQEGFATEIQSLNCLKVLSYAVQKYAEKTGKSAGFMIVGNPDLGSAEVKVTFQDNASDADYQELMFFVNKSQELFSVIDAIETTNSIVPLPVEIENSLKIKAQGVSRELNEFVGK